MLSQAQIAPMVASQLARVLQRHGERRAFSTDIQLKVIYLCMNGTSPTGSLFLLFFRENVWTVEGSRERANSYMLNRTGPFDLCCPASRRHQGLSST